jgi:hypothetical protein
LGLHIFGIEITARTLASDLRRRSTTTTPTALGRPLGGAHRPGDFEPPALRLPTELSDQLLSEVLRALRPPSETPSLSEMLRALRPEGPRPRHLIAGRQYTPSKPSDGGEASGPVPSQRLAARVREASSPELDSFSRRLSASSRSAQGRDPDYCLTGFRARASVRQASSHRTLAYCA